MTISKANQAAKVSKALGKEERGLEETKRQWSDLRAQAELCGEVILSKPAMWGVDKEYNKAIGIYTNTMEAAGRMMDI